MLLYLNFEKMNAEQIQALPEYILINVPSKEWRFISMTEGLSEEFMRKYSDKLWWASIGYRQDLSEEFIRDYIGEYGLYESLIRKNIKDISVIHALKAMLHDWYQNRENK